MTTRKFKVAVVGTATATATVEIDVPIDWIADADSTNFTEERVNELASRYVDNLASDNGIAIDWKIGPVEFERVLKAQEVK